MHGIKQIRDVIEFGPLVHIDHHDLPDLDMLALEAYQHAIRTREQDQGWVPYPGEDDVTAIYGAFGDSGEAQVGWFRWNPCNPASCYDGGHRAHLCDVDCDDDGNPTGRSARGAFLGVFFQ